MNRMQTTIGVGSKCCGDRGWYLKAYRSVRIYLVKSGDSGTLRHRIDADAMAAIKHAIPTMENPPKASANPPMAEPPIAPS